jgi:acetoin utilization protein AcuB
MRVRDLMRTQTVPSVRADDDVAGTTVAETSIMTVTVKDVMTPAPLVIVGPDDDLERAGQTMAWTRVRHMPVLQDGLLVGILSERDFIRARVFGGSGPAATVRSAMRAPVAWIGPDEPITSALSLMVSRNIGCLPVMSSDGIAGMLTTTDLLRHQLYAAFDRPSG